MSTTVFAFQVERPYNEGRPHRTTRFGVGSEYSVTRPERGTYGLFWARGSVRLPGKSLDISDWDSFLQDRQGGHDTFLFKAHRTSLNSETNLTQGTGDGTTAAFTMTHKYIDASTLVVKVSNVTRTLTTQYTFAGNNTTPIVTFNSTIIPSNSSVVTATFDYYYSVKFVGDPSPEDETDLHLTSSVTTSHYRYGFAVIEDGAENHRV